jgi:hypothetical protein
LKRESGTPLHPDFIIAGTAKSRVFELAAVQGPAARRMVEQMNTSAAPRLDPKVAAEPSAWFEADKRIGQEECSGLLGGAASKPPLGGAATQTRDSFCRVLSAARSALNSAIGI